MKIFKLAKAELSKLFARPAIFLMVGFLVIALTLVSFFYNPTPRIDNRINYEGITTTEIYTQFENEKGQLIEKLTQTKDEILTFSNTIVNSQTKLHDLKNKVEISYNNFERYEQSLVTNSTLSEIKTTLQSFKQSVINVYQTLANIETNIDFFITRSELNDLKTFFTRLNNDLPSNTSSYSVQNLQELGTYLALNRSYSDHVYPILNNLNSIELNGPDTSKIVEIYYDNIYINSDSKLEKQSASIEEFYNSHLGSSEEDDLKALNQLFSEYNSIIVMANECLENEFLLLKTNNLTNAKLNTYVGFENVNLYKLQETITKNTYLLNNDKFEIDYSNNFNFGTTAGFSTSAYDFTVFAMQILSIIIAVFCLFFGSGLIAGEHSGKTMKMLAIRPYTRNKIYLGKLVACISFMLILLLVSFVASFVVGGVMFGFELAPVLMVFNSTSVAVVSPIVMLLIYMLSLILNLLFYISLALLLSVIFRSGAVAVLTSFIVYIATVLCNMLLTSLSWFKVLPIAHLDLFKYFGSSNVAGGFLNFNLIIDANFYLSLGYLLGFTLILNLISLLVFKKRNIA